MVRALPNCQPAGTVNDAVMGICFTGVCAGYITTPFHSSTVMLTLVEPVISERCIPA